MIRESRGNVRRSKLPVIVRVRAGLRGVRGLGFTYYDLLNNSGIEDCDPRDTACTMRNTERANAAEDLWVSTYMTHSETANMAAPVVTYNLDTSQAALTAYNNNQPMTSESITVNGGAPVSVAQIEQNYSAPVVPGSTSTGQSVVPTSQKTSPPATATTYHPVVAIENLSSGNAGTLEVGDSWRITITGGQPNADVLCTGGNNGARATSKMGTTDAAGTFTLRGVITADSIGQWYELWSVGGATAGSFTFTVPAPAPVVTTPKTPATPAKPATPATPGTDGSGAPAPAAGVTFDSIMAQAKALPWYAWAGIAGGVVILPRLLGGRR